MILTHWLYLSRSCGDGGGGPAFAERHQLDRNARPGVTGMMVCTDHWCAEWLEGSAEAIAGLHAEIVADPVREGVVTLEEGAVPTRQFADWSLAYVGRAVGVEQVIANAASGVAGGRDGLLAMLREFHPAANTGMIAPNMPQRS